MTLKIADRVKETSTTAGTGTLNLAGAAIGFQTFVAGVGNGNTCFYAISHQTADEWEVGIGTVTDASPDTLARTTVLQSSNSDSAVSFAAGTKDVFVTYPAGKAVYKDATGKVGIGTESPSYTLDVREARAGYDSWVQSSGVRVGPSGTVLLDADLSRSITVKSPDVVSTSFTLPLPSGIGSNGQVLTSDSKQTYWAAPVPTIANDAANKLITSDGDGTFTAEANLTYDGGSFTVNRDMTVGATGGDAGFDIKFYGFTNGRYLHWSESQDELGLIGAAKIVFNDIGGGENIYASADGHLQINAGTTLDITAPTVDINVPIGVAGGKLNVDGLIEASGITVGASGITVTGDLNVGEYIYHNDDADTYIRFQNDSINIYAGNRSMIKLDEGSTDKVIINNGTQDVDLQVKGDADSNLIRTDAANDRVGIGTSSPSYRLDVSGDVRASGVRVGGSGSGVLVKAQGTFGDYTLMLPSGNGTNGQVLTTDSKNTYWSTVSGGSTDLNGLDAGAIAAADSIAFIDADDNGSKKESLADFLDVVAGTVGTTGLDRSGGTLVVSDLHPVGVTGSADQLITDDGDGTVTSEANLQFDGTNLGIGIDPSAPLHISVSASTLIHASGSGRTASSRVRFIAGDGAATTTMSLHLLSGNNSSSYVYMGDTDDPDNGYIRYKNAGSANQMHFRTNTKDKMIIASDGRIGLGAGQGAAVATVGHIDVVAHSGCIMASGIRGCLETSTDQAVVNFDIASSTAHNVVLGGNRTLAVKNTRAGDRFILRLTQDGAGSRTVTWFSTIKWAGGSAPTLTTTASKADVVGFLCTGTNAFDGFVIGQNI